MSVYYNDIDPYCCKVLQKNIDNGNLPGGHVDERDIRTVHAKDFMGYTHIHLFAGIGGFPLGLRWANYPSWLRTVSGGFPCQNISNAGKRAGITGEQSGLWKEMYRLIQESTDCYGRFDYILIENVSALLGRGLDTVLIDLAQAGYNAQWTTLRASDFGAPHRRERVFVVAYPVRRGQALDDTQSKRWGVWHTENERKTNRTKHTLRYTSQTTTQLAYPQSIGSRSWRAEWESAREAISYSPGTLADTQFSTPRMEEQGAGGQGRQHSNNSQREMVRQGNGSVDAKGLGAGSKKMAYPTIEGLEGQQWQELQGGGMRSPNGYQTLADAESEQDRGLRIRELQPNLDASGVGQADANRQGLQIRDGSANEGRAFPAIDGRSTGQLESIFCRGIVGLSDRLDGYRWPARPGEVQYEWEPERIVTEKVPHRVQRLKALGNSIVPQCVEHVARCILASLEAEQGESEGVA